MKISANIAEGMLNLYSWK